MMRNLFCSIVVIGFVAAGVYAQPELDTTFNGTGKAVYSIVEKAGAKDMAVQPDNKIIMVSGCYKQATHYVPFCLVRLNEDGSIDTTFGSAGIPENLGSPGSVLTKFNISTLDGENGQAYAIELQSDGKILVGGRVTNQGSDNKIAMARYNADGSLDTTFGTGGRFYKNVAGGHMAETVHDIAIQPDGKIVVTGTWVRIIQPPATWNFWVQFTARFHPNGTLDTSFGQGGVVTDHSGTYQGTYGTSIAIQPDGKIIIGGDILNNHPVYPIFSSYYIRRFNPDGSDDSSWNVVRSTIVGIAKVVLLPDGRLLAISSTPARLLRFLSDGTPDPSFGTNGELSVLRPNLMPRAMTVSADGKINVIGMWPMGSDDEPEYPYAVERFFSNGTPDPAFGDNGFLKVFVSNTHDGARAGALDPSGRLVVAGFTTVATDFQNAKFSAIRLTAPAIVPTAVTVGGRVTSSDGLPISGLTLRMFDGSGGISLARTNPFGYYQFPNVMSGQLYSIAVKSRTVVIAERSIFVGGQVSNFDFTGAPQPSSKGALKENLIRFK